jgi:hypothetical protein
VKKNILFPIDFKPSRYHLSDYAHLLAHLDRKSFTGFFLRDFVKPPKGKSPIVSEQDKAALQTSLQEEAKSLAVDLNFINSQPNANSLLIQSKFADLAVISPVTHENIGQLIKAFPDHFLEEAGCPILLTEDIVKPYEEILVLFDYDQSGLAALKSFLAMFGRVSGDKKVTIITVNPDDAPEIHLEKFLVSYLQKVFSDVGIVPFSSKNLADQLVHYASRLNKPLLVMGHAAINLLKDNHLTKKIADHHMSIFYSNH